MLLGPSPPIGRGMMTTMLNKAPRQTASGWLYSVFSFGAIWWAYNLKWAIITVVAMLVVCVVGQVIIARFVDSLRGHVMVSYAYRRAMGVRTPRRPFQTFPSDI